MTDALKLKLGLGLILAVALIAGYYGCGGSSSSSDSGSSAPLFSTGAPDTTFGTGGLAATAIGGDNDIARAIAIQPDGKIIAVGVANNGANDDFALARYTITGTLDTTFDTDGIVTTTIGSGAEYAYAIALQPDGKILLAGYAVGANEDFALARYTITGTLDTSFDTDGIVTTTIGSGTDRAYGIALQTDGKILLAGAAVSSNFDFALARYNTNGTLDTTFDTDGIVTTMIGSVEDSARAITLQPDGKILLAGYVFRAPYYDFALARYNTNGALDTAFDTDGLVTTTFTTGDAFAYGIALQSDGKILIAGNAWDGANENLAMARYNSNGSLDTAFDTDGLVTTGVGYDAFAYGIVLQPDNKIILGGCYNNGVDNDFALIRYWR